MYGNLDNRLKKAEQSYVQPADKRAYIEAAIRHLSGQDNGESLRALPPMANNSKSAKLALFVVAINAIKKRGLALRKELRINPDEKANRKRG